MPPFTPDQICFGLNRQLDIQSFSCFLQLIGRPEFADILAQRLSSTEIDAVEPKVFWTLPTADRVG